MLRCLTNRRQRFREGVRARRVCAATSSASVRSSRSSSSHTRTLADPRAADSRRNQLLGRAWVRTR